MFFCYEFVRQLTVVCAVVLSFFAKAYLENVVVLMLLCCIAGMGAVQHGGFSSHGQGVPTWILYVCWGHQQGEQGMCILGVEGGGIQGKGA